LLTRSLNLPVSEPRIHGFIVTLVPVPLCSVR
jgi:hypothetical protein